MMHEDSGWAAYLTPLDADLRALLHDCSAALILAPGLLATTDGRVWLNPGAGSQRLHAAAADRCAAWLQQHGRVVAVADLWAAPRAGGLPLKPWPARPSAPQLLASHHGIGVVIGMNGCLSLRGPCPLGQLPVADIAWLLAHCPRCQGDHPLADLFASPP